MKKNLTFLLLLLFCFPVNAAQEWFSVKEIINGKSFILNTGDKVRLASIQVPNVQEIDTAGHYGRPGEPMGEEAKKALAGLLANSKIRIDYNPGKRDRHERLLGQVYDDKGNWIQGQMLAQGYAMVYSFNDDAPEIIQKMLVEERKAITAKSGLWSHPYFRIISPLETAQYINRFKLVEGKVISVNRSHDNIYLNFSEQWRGNFAVFISHKNRNAFDYVKLQVLVGQKIRVRGWINYHNAPMITITHSEQIEPQ